MNDLERFHKAQQSKNSGYAQAYEEIMAGNKTSHWIWYIFPQLRMLGFSFTAKYYGIVNFKEACDYLRDSLLFKHYNEIVEIIEQQLIADPTKPLNKLMGSQVDADKLSSSLTLFREVASFLGSQEGKPKHDFNGLKNRCDNIFILIAKQNYYPCERTLSYLKPHLVQ
jgi:uncharacterized protein (DUF1810 family)